MKKRIALILICMLVLPAAALAEPPAEPSVSFMYNGQTYDCTYNTFQKCCGEADTCYDLWLTPVGSEEIGSINLTFPSTAKTGDKYLLRRGEAHEWVTFYVTGGTKAQHYVSAPGSLFGTGLVSESDYYELTVDSLENVQGVAYIAATVRASFMSGEMDFAIDFNVKVFGV